LKNKPVLTRQQISDHLKNLNVSFNGLRESFETLMNLLDDEFNRQHEEAFENEK